ncbi:class I SAM-dependent methyltransferase [Falsibacillus pallidus]|uniref:class I SAM-dependent methyltransferase n=1 Tax=Falsibacillus pallidus TaxID=493781 RepID=UPI003D954FA0
MKNNHKISLEKEQETLLITLYAKAIDSRLENSILHDEKASEIQNLIDYDFEKFNTYDNGKVMVLRAKQFDDWIVEFLDFNPSAVIVNLGCGLDTRVSRINPGQGVRWFDVDFPEVIKVRKLFFSNGSSYEMIESSVTDEGWLCHVPQDKPVMVVAEGILEYLTEEEVKTLFNRITSYFSKGQISFDVMNTFAIQSGKDSLKQSTGAEHKWAIDDTSEVDKLFPILKKMNDLSVFSTRYVRKLPWKLQLLYRLMRLIPSFRNMIRLLRYQF